MGEETRSVGEFVVELIRAITEHDLDLRARIFERYTVEEIERMVVARYSAFLPAVGLDGEFLERTLNREIQRRLRKGLSLDEGDLIAWTLARFGEQFRTAEARFERSVFLAGLIAEIVDAESL